MHEHCFNNKIFKKHSKNKREQYKNVFFSCCSYTVPVI